MFLAGIKSILQSFSETKEQWKGETAPHPVYLPLTPSTQGNVGGWLRDGL